MKLALLLLAAAPQSATFVFELQGFPVGVVELSADGDRYTYRSRHWFAHGSTDTSETLSLLKVRPESWWFWHKPKPGCEQVRAELTGEMKEACALSIDKDVVRGRIGNDAFAARYDRDLLVELTIGAAHFVPGKAPRTIDDPFANGFPIRGTKGALAVDPPAPGPDSKSMDWEGARALAAQIHNTTDGDCVAHARRFQQLARSLRHDAAIILGLVEDKGRAWPHAWVRVGSLELDPTLDHPVTRERYLPFVDAGQVYVDLLAGKRIVVRN